MYRLMAKYGAGDARECGALAEESFRHALALNPELSVAHHFSAQLDLDLGRPREALLRLLGRAREHRADPQLFAGLVQACRYCGLLTESVAADRRARALDPNVPTSVAYTHWAVGDYAAALDAIVADNDAFRGVVLATLNRPGGGAGVARRVRAAVGAVSDAGGVCRAHTGVSAEAARGLPIPHRPNLSVDVSGSRRVHLRRDLRDVDETAGGGAHVPRSRRSIRVLRASRTSIESPRSSRSKARRNSRACSPKPSGAIARRSTRSLPPAGPRFSNAKNPSATDAPCSRTQDDRGDVDVR